MSLGHRLNALRAPVRRGLRVLWVFIWMGYQEALAYPLALVMTAVSLLAQPVIYYFVAQLVVSGPDVGGDYYTFVFLGFVVSTMMNGALSAFSAQLDNLLGTGTFETLLVEPVSWRWLSFGMVVWPIFRTVVTTALIGVMGFILGAEINLAQLPYAILIIALGVASAHAVGVLAASIKVLSKRADPVLAVYLLGATVLSGVAFPVTLLPGWLRWMSYLLPMTYVLTAVRKLLMIGATGLTGPSPFESVLLLLGFLAVVYPLGLWLYGRSLEYGRKLGVLAGY
jgi:ABC-2 type transport system permease protein